MAVLPKSKKFGLQSKVDPRAVGPDIPVFLVCEILSVCDCHLTVDPFPTSKGRRVLK